MVKSKSVLVYRNWDEVNQALKELGEIERSITKIESDMNRSIDDIKADADRDAAPLLSRKKILEKNIEEFVESSKGEFSTLKSKLLLYGTVGFRRTTSIITRNVQAIIEALKQNRMQNCIITTEKINKEELEKYDDAALQKVGAKRKSEDTFYYKLNTERVDA